jgi:hypothetical protein
MKKLLYLFILFSNVILSQNITNTLGTSGLFSIKNGSATYLSLSQSNGYLSLNHSLVLQNTTNSTTGIIFKDADRFLHNYGNDNLFFGVNSGNFFMSGNVNTAVGNSSLFSNITGQRNSAFGYASLFGNTGGNFNSAFGHRSLESNTTGNANTAFGGHSLTNNSTGSLNSAFGISTLFSFGPGNSNSAFGTSSLTNNSTGSFNSAFGEYSLRSNTTGIFNSAFGYYSLRSNTDGVSNCAFGDSSLSNSSTGDRISAIGYSSGSTITGGFNLTLIGYDAEPTTGVSFNQITLGNNQITSLRCNVTTITSLSDSRDKKNIIDLPLGLDFISKLKPRLFNWDKREWYDDNVSDGSKMMETPTAGFIAQELDDIQTTENAEWLNLVLKDNPDKLEATPGNLLPIMVKAIQELKAENDKVKTESEELKNQLSQLALLQLQFLNEIEATKSNNSEIKEIKSTEK